ncbi:VOC family protein [Dyadobacter luticola]|uniref:VOC family protein n=1 Tax=Dyadobacter luticola TaxID=1979387 RepID=A0A5R9KZJ2_9BACT|nr:VOC family protein [Dyadobacter luticola]TLV01507.1 VOC family protein [Dyadobacter luticola]
MDQNPAQAIIVPTLSVRNGGKAIEFYQEAFRAAILMSNVSPDGEVVAELEVMGARFVVADESEEYGNVSPERQKGISVRIGLQVEDPDALFAQAVKAGATVVYEVADQSYGYRLGHLIDPFGHHWEIFKPIPFN